MDYSIRDQLPSTRDQGQRSTCLAFAVSAAHGLACAGASRFIELSEEMVHQAAKVKGGHGDAVSLPSMNDGLEDGGQCVLKLWPYENVELVLTPSKEAAADGMTRKPKLSGVDITFQKIRESILQGLPVVLVLKMCQAFFSTTTGFVATPVASEVIPGLHAVLATGVLGKAGSERLEFRNSWGPTWGSGGYGWIAESYVADHVVAAVLVEPA